MFSRWFSRLRMELIKNNEKPRRKSWGLCLKLKPQLSHRVFSMVSLSSDRINHKQRETSTTKMGFIWAWRPAASQTERISYKGCAFAGVLLLFYYFSGWWATGSRRAPMDQNDPKSCQKGTMGAVKAKMHQNDNKSDQKKNHGSLEGQNGPKPYQIKPERRHGGLESQNGPKRPQIRPEKVKGSAEGQNGPKDPKSDQKEPWEF